ncbi:hypothetical protein DYB31_016589, partial [Aphanomyces astaci]
CIASDAKEALPRPQLTSLDNAVQALKEAKRIVVVVGAGISVSCGIPDFRSKDGIYAMVKDMALDSFTPSLTHRFLRRLQDQHQLLRVYSQNVDGLEAAAGVTNADLVLVMGTSLQVSPVADIPVYLNAVPQILINMESVTPKGKLGFRGFDIECLGPCDVIVEYFMAALDGNTSVLSPPMHVHPPNRYCFDGCHLNDVATEEGAPPSIDSFHW